MDSGLHISSSLRFTPPFEAFAPFELVLQSAEVRERPSVETGLLGRSIPEIDRSSSFQELNPVSLVEPLGQFLRNCITHSASILPPDGGRGHGDDGLFTGRPQVTVSSDLIFVYDHSCEVRCGALCSAGCGPSHADQSPVRVTTCEEY